MARTSKIALAVAAALAVVTVLAGSAFAAASGGASGDRAQTVGALSLALEGDDARTADAGRDSGGSWQGSAGRARYPGPMGGFRDGGGYWTAGEILQWIAIGLIGGAAVGLAVWRPWRPARDGVGTARVAAVTTATPTAPATGFAPFEQTGTAPTAPATIEAVTLGQEAVMAEPAARTPAGPAQSDLARPRHWRKHERP